MKPVKRKVLPPQPMTPEQAVEHMKRKKYRLLNARIDRQHRAFVKKAESGKFWSFVTMIFYIVTGQWLWALFMATTHNQRKSEIEMAKLMRNRRRD